MLPRPTSPKLMTFYLSLKQIGPCDAEMTAFDRKREKQHVWGFGAEEGGGDTKPCVDFRK